jgi:hypothetical protein
MIIYGILNLNAPGWAQIYLYMKSSVNRIHQRHSSRKIILHELSIILVLILMACPARTVEPAHIKYKTDAPSEYELKAIYLYNFLQFVQWPRDKCPLPDGKAQEIGVLGDSAFKPVLKALQEKLKTKNQYLQLTFYGPYHEGMDLSNCCLLFISASEQEKLPGILDSLGDKPVLTVADSDTFITPGVMITLVSHQNKIRWAIDREPVNRAGLRLSSKLLDIAVQVIN